MPAFKISKHYNELKRCAECRNDTMRFDQLNETWLCFSCGNKAREDFGQTVLPTTRELEQDDFAADNALSQEQRPLYFKSIRQGNTESDYEASVNQGAFNAAGSENKYRGSAQEALQQDRIKFANERIRQSNMIRQQRGQFSSTGQDQDSQESLIDRHMRRKLKERDDSL